MIRCSFFSSGVVLIVLDARSRPPNEPAPPPRMLVVHPAGEPIPALRYSLLPRSAELIPGNAAIFYHRAIEFLLSDTYRRQIRALKTKESSETASSEAQVKEWLAIPPSQLPLDTVRRLVDEHRRILHEVELGARRDFCDWEFDRREEGYELSIEEIQETRRLARLVSLRARFEIAEGRVDAAMDWIRTGLALARHVSKGRIYIQSMIAASITSEMERALEELIQAPACPNLYWAIAALPRPFIDLTAATEGEGLYLEREFPMLRTVEDSVWSLEQARTFGDDLERKGGMLLDMWRVPKSTLTRPTFADLAEHLVVTGFVARAYPEAKRKLIASGMPAERVEAMPAVQVVTIHSYRAYKEKRDDLFKWMSIPYFQVDRGMTEAETKAYADSQPGFPFFAFLPSIRQIFFLQVRTDRQFAAVQTVEAVRCYAASHDGSPPPNLEALTETPAPRDPVTGDPFTYTVDGAGFTLTAAPRTGIESIPQYAVNYAVKLARRADCTRTCIRTGSEAPAEPASAARQEPRPPGSVLATGSPHLTKSTCQEITMFRKFALIGFLLVFASIESRAADPRAEAIAPFLDADVVMVGRINVDTFDVEKLAGRLVEDQASAALLTKNFGPWLAALRKAGARDLYILGRLENLPGAVASPPSAVATLTQAGDADAIGKLLCGGGDVPTPYPWPTCAKIQGVVFAGSNDAVENAGRMKPVARPELAEALAAARDSASEVVFMPSADARRVFEEMMPNLPAEFGGGPMTTLTRDVRWGVLTLKDQPEPALRFVLRARMQRRRNRSRGLGATSTERFVSRPK